MVSSPLIFTFVHVTYACAVLCSATLALKSMIINMLIIIDFRARVALQSRTSHEQRCDVRMCCLVRWPRRSRDQTLHDARFCENNIATVRFHDQTTIQFRYRTTAHFCNDLLLRSNSDPFLRPYNSPFLMCIVLE